MLKLSETCEQTNSKEDAADLCQAILTLSHDAKNANEPESLLEVDCENKILGPKFLSEIALLLVTHRDVNVKFNNLREQDRLLINKMIDWKIWEKRSK